MEPDGILYCNERPWFAWKFGDKRGLGWASESFREMTREVEPDSSYHDSVWTLIIPKEYL
jgi:hypothetical protein